MTVAVVTGAARGIGAATVRHLAHEGYRILAIDSADGSRAPYAMPRRADLNRVVAPFGDQVKAAVVDVRDRDQLAKIIQGTADEWGRLDVAVAAAAVIRGGSALWETRDDELVEMFEVNVRGVWNTAAVTIPLMLDGPEPSRCRFVAVASAAGRTGMFHLAGYNVAKHGVIGLVRGLAADLTRTGVTACAVSPGSTETPMLAATANLYGVSPDELVSRQSLGRVLTPEELAATIAFACSEAGAVLNGSVVNADGGFVG